MGAPVIAAAALNSRTGRKILAGAFIGFTVVVAFLMTPHLPGDTAAAFRAADGAIQPLFVLRRFVEGDLSGLFEDASTVEFDHPGEMADSY